MTWFSKVCRRVFPGVGSSSLLWAFLITSITSLWREGGGGGGGGKGSEGKRGGEIVQEYSIVYRGFHVTQHNMQKESRQYILLELSFLCMRNFLVRHHLQLVLWINYPTSMHNETANRCTSYTCRDALNTSLSSNHHLPMPARWPQLTNPPPPPPQTCQMASCLSNGLFPPHHLPT